jgi:3-oxoadipate enol-lactonase
MVATLVEANGTSLAVETTGSGPTIVFSHGLLWSGALYAAQVAELSKRYCCITYDHRGHGASPASLTPYSMETLADDAAALVVKLGVAPCHFVGLSMGGFVGMRLAARRPELVRSLTLIDTAADSEPLLNRPRYRALLALEAVVGVRPLLRLVMPIMFGDKFIHDTGRVRDRERAVAILTKLDGAPLRAAVEAVLRRKPVFKELGHISVPTLVLHGAADRAVRMPRARAMADAIRGAQFVVVPEAGHSSTFEEPDFVTQQLAAFLESQPVLAES